MTTPDNSIQFDALLQRLRDGDREVLGEVLDFHRGRLLRMVRLRMAPELQARINEWDVLQETYLEVAVRLESYLRNSEMPFFLWLRFLTRQTLLKLARKHLASMRTPHAEVPLGGVGGDATSVALAEQISGTSTGPLSAVMRSELKRLLVEKFNAMDPTDREILALRHFEQLTNAETALELKITETAASKRYNRALKRLKSIIADIPRITGEGG